jgi:hypothetical protein
MHPLLDEAAGIFGEEWTNLAAASARTAERRAAASAAIDGFLTQVLGTRRNPEDEPLIAAFGSMARDEMAPRSDFDYLVVLDHVEEDPGLIQVYRRAAQEGLRSIGVDAPGQSGLFGVATSGAELVNTIGLDTDSNLRMSRRVLLLEESVPLNADASWTRLAEAVVARYLYEQHRESPFVPRFLLNDVVRYWRTIAVDYQAKRWEEMAGKKWGLRYAKLLTSRKLVFAGMVTTLFLPVLSDQAVTVGLLRDQCRLPALARLAQLVPILGDEGRDSLRRLISHADRVVGWFADATFRTALEPIENPRAAEDGSAMHQIRELGERIQDDLESLFFSDEPLRSTADATFGSVSRRYLTF